MHSSQRIKTTTTLSIISHGNIAEQNPVGSFVPKDLARACQTLVSVRPKQPTTGVCPCLADDVMRLKRAKTDASSPSTNRWTTCPCWCLCHCVLVTASSRSATVSPRVPSASGLFVVPGAGKPVCLSRRDISAVLAFEVVEYLLSKTGPEINCPTSRVEMSADIVESGVVSDSIRLVKPYARISHRQETILGKKCFRALRPPSLPANSKSPGHTICSHLEIRYTECANPGGGGRVVAGQPSCRRPLTFTET